MATSLIHRFMAKVSVNDETGCWEWTAATTDGYSTFYFLGATRAGHRVSYELFVGEIPEGMQIDHLCNVRRCVNPEHLAIVTGRENLNRRVLPRGAETFHGRKTHCPKGHPYDEANTIHGQGSRTCRTCRRAYQRVYRARRRAEA